MSIGLFEDELHICAIDKLPLPSISILAKFGVQWNNEEVTDLHTFLQIHTTISRWCLPKPCTPTVS